MNQSFKFENYEIFIEKELDSVHITNHLNFEQWYSYKLIKNKTSKFYDQMFLYTNLKNYIDRLFDLEIFM